MPTHGAAGLALALALALAACGADRVRPAAVTSASAPACDAREPAPPEAPRLASAADAVFARFDPARALATVGALDGYYRLRGNSGYEASLAAVRARLAEGGFTGEEVETLALGPELPTFRPVRGELVLVGEGGASDARLHAFGSEGDPERLLALGGPARVEGVFEVARPGEDARGKVLFGRASARSLHAAAKRAGAAGFLSHALHPVAAARTGAIGYQRMPDPTGEIFGLSISGASANAIARRIDAGGPVRVRVRLELTHEAGRATTLAARLDVPRTAADGGELRGGAAPSLGAEPAGAEHGAPAPLVFFAHVDEPGAVDDASGVAALAELAVALRAAVRAGAVPPPRRPMVFLFGQELESAARWMDRASCSRDATERCAGARPAAALVLDMVGPDPARVDAELLVERMPDPSAFALTPPDRPSGWGASPAPEAAARGHFLDAYVELAFAREARARGALPHRGHPFEGGSDHVPFLEAGVPAVLVWHFPDDAYHTSDDRAERVSGERMARVAAALGAAAVGLASGDARDGGEMRDAVVFAARRRAHHLARSADEGAGARATAAAFARHFEEALEALLAGGFVDADAAREGRAEVRARLGAVERCAGRAREARAGVR